jgi:hypothetical protein
MVDEALSDQTATSGYHRWSWRSRTSSRRDWIETSLSEGRKAVGGTWVFKVKTDADGNVVKYKSRLVAQGFASAGRRLRGDVCTGRPYHIPSTAPDHSGDKRP